MRWPCAQVIAISRSVRESMNAEDLSIGSSARDLHVKKNGEKKMKTICRFSLLQKRTI